MGKGRDFEKLVSDIERALYNLPGVTVTHDIKLPDVNGGKRQIDVLITDERSRFVYKTIIECKDTKSKVDINVVEAFKGLIRSVGAHQGIIVSANGFQAGALRAIKDTNVYLYQLSQSAELENHLKEFRFNVYELKHESKDIVVGFNQPNQVNEYVTSKSPLFSSATSKSVSIAEIAKVFLEARHQSIADAMLRSVTDPFKAQTIISSTEISIKFLVPMIFIKDSVQTEVAGFRAIIETTLITGPLELKNVSAYNDVVRAQTEALIFELNWDGNSYQWLEKYFDKKK
jgi:restriction endonuclease